MLALHAQKAATNGTAIALYMIIAWRVQQLTMLGRRCPELPCDVVFEIEEWSFGGFLNRRVPPMIPAHGGL